MQKIVLKYTKFSRNTFYVWKRENRPVIKLFEYIGTENLEEYLETGKIKKYELIKHFTYNEIKDMIHELEKVDIQLLKIKLYQFNRASLLYLLFIFKKHQEIKSHRDLMKFIQNNNEANTIWDKIVKFSKNFKITFIESDNVSGPMHLNDFSRYCKFILNNTEVNYLLQNYEFFYDDILLIVNQKR